MNALIAEHAWDRTSLGSKTLWPQSLTSIVDLVTASPLATIVLWGPELIQIYNDGYAVICGPRHPAALGQATRDCWPEVWAFNEPVYKAVLNGEARTFPRQMLTIQRHGVSEDAWFDLTYSSLRDDSGSIAGVLVTVVEISAQVIAEGRLAEQVTRQRRLFQQSPGFVCILDGPEHVYEFANAAYERLVGRSDLIGNTVRAALPDIAGQGFYELLDTVYATGERFVAEHVAVSMVRAPGGSPEERFVDFVYEPVISENGDVTGVFAQGHDVTDAHRIERRQVFRSDLDDALRGMADPREVIATAAERLGERLAASRCGFAEIDEAMEFVTVLRDWTDGSLASAAGRFRMNDFGEAFMDGMRAGRVVRLDDALADPLTQGDDVAAAYAALDFRAVLAVPVLKAGQWVAAIFVHQAVPRVWTDEDAALVLEVAERTWATVGRARAEAALRDLNADLERQVAERTREFGRTWAVSPDLLGVLNDAGHFETSNPAWMAMLGWSPDEIAAMTVFDFLHPDDQEKTHREFEALKGGKPALNFENRYRCKDGSYRWLSWVAVPEGGKYYCTGRDITPDKARATALTALTVDLNRVWQNSRDMLVVAGADGVFRAASPAWTKVLGYEASETVGHSFNDFIWPEDAEAAQAAVEMTVAGGQLTGFENRYRHKDGTPRWISWQTSFESDVIYAYGRDVTEERAQTEELRGVEAHLRQAQKMEAVGQLTGGIAHDFNNMLTGVIGGLDIVQRRLAAGHLDDVDRFINMARESGERAAGLTKRLLAFSRRQSLDLKILDVNGLTQGMQDLLRRTLSENLDMTMTFQKDVWPVEADGGQLENAILNLVINSRDAMPNGGVLAIETANVTLNEADTTRSLDLPPGDYVRISVSDQGVGMSEAVQAKAFDPFFTTKTVGQGTGLGLSMIYGFIKQSRGHVSIVSEAGQGTTVELWLPRAASVISVGVAPVAVDLKRPQAGATVMIVEDEPAVRLLVTEILAELGYDFVEAANGDAALPILRSAQRIDLLITDVGLPGMNGRQLAEMARALRPGLKVLFVTGYAEQAAVRSSFLEEGMDMVAKPFALDALGKKIEIMVSH